MQIRQCLSDCSCALPLAAALAAARGRGGGCGRVWSSGHARAAAETADCRLGRLRGRSRAPNSAAPSTSSPLIGRQFEVSSLSVGLSAVSVGLVVESGRAIDFPSWSSRVLCTCWGSGFRRSRKEDFRRLRPSSRLVVGMWLCLCVSVDTAPLSSPSSRSISISLVRS